MRTQNRLGLGAEKGHRRMSQLCTRFVTHLFACPQYSPAISGPGASLPNFIAYVLRRTNLHHSIVFASLILLQRLKSRFPTAQGSSGHRLFTSTLMMAAKIFLDDAYSNKSWVTITQGMFPLREINQMEREICKFLDWDLTIHNPMLADFEKQVVKDFSLNHSQYPSYPLAFVSKRAASTTTIPRREAPIITASLSGVQTTQSPRALSTHRSNSLPSTPPCGHLDISSPASKVCLQSSVSSVEPNSKACMSELLHGVEEALGFTHISEVHPLHLLRSQVFAFAVPSRF